MVHPAFLFVLIVPVLMSLPTFAASKVNKCAALFSDVRMQVIKEVQHTLGAQVEIKSVISEFPNMPYSSRILLVEGALHSAYLYNPNTGSLKDIPVRQRYQNLDGIPQSEVANLPKIVSIPIGNGKTKSFSTKTHNLMTDEVKVELGPYYMGMNILINRVYEISPYRYVALGYNLKNDQRVYIEYNVSSRQTNVSQTPNTTWNLPEILD